MIQPNDHLHEVPGSTALWRYWDFTKFVSFLERGALYFCRVDKFEDRWEGELTRPALEAVQALYGRKEDDFREFAERQRGRILVNCWHGNDVESAAMWRLYTQTREAIAVKSSVGKLTAALADAPETLHWGEVAYIDFNGDAPRWNWNYLTLATWKRKSFEHEREVRLILFLGAPGREQIEAPEHGHYVPIDVARAVEAVYVGPDAPDWFHGLVEQLVTRYGYNFPVERSALSQH